MSSPHRLEILLERDQAGRLHAFLLRAGADAFDILGDRPVEDIECALGACDRYLRERYRMAPAVNYVWPGKIE